MNKICVSVEAVTSEEFMEKIAELSKNHDFFELRLDALTDCTPDNIRQTLDQVTVECIATVRSIAEGGKFAGAKTEHAACVRVCLQSKVAYCDVELTLLEELPDLIELRDPKTILITHHDFGGTPDDDTLNGIIGRMRSLAPNSIYKIACMANTVEDVVHLSELQKAQPAGKSVIIAMGEKGQLLRLLGPTLGAFTSFAGSEKKPVAPGQLYYKKMKELLAAMAMHDGRQ